MPSNRRLPSPPHPPAALFLIAVGALGLSSSMTQLAVMRELLGVFAGNEMVLGIVLGLWLLLMGCGTALGRLAIHFSKRALVFALLLILLGILPLAQVCAVRALRELVFLPGAELGLTETVTTSLVLLAAYCIPAGFGLSLACSVLCEQEGATSASRVYVADSLGTVAGALLFTVLLTPLLDHISILVVPAILNFLAAATVGYQAGYRSAPAAATILLVGVVAGAFAPRLDVISTSWQYPGQQLLFRANSPYGKLVVTSAAGQTNLLQNGILLACTPDLQRVEETVHYPLSQRPQASRVLLLGGGISGTANELLKYPRCLVDYVELDPLILPVGRHFLLPHLGAERVLALNADARISIASRRAQYDVIILDLPPPSTAQFNRFYTREFFEQAKRALAPQGVLSFSVGQYENYVSPTLARLLSSACASVKTCFTNALIIPGNRIFLLASDGPLFTNIADRVEAAGLKTALLRRSYLDAMLAPDRVADMLRAAAQTAPVNQDLKPVLYYYHLRHWMSQFHLAVGPVQVLVILAILIFLATVRGNAVLIFSAGFASASLQFVLLLVFQIFCGSVYHQVGVLLALFMAGLALGGWLGVRSAGAVLQPAKAITTTGDPGPDPARALVSYSMSSTVGKALRGLRLVPFLSLLIALFALGLPTILGLMHDWSRTAAGLWGIKAMIGGLTLMLATFGGLQFAAANLVEPGATGASASRLFTADFVGASLGALLASTLIVPVLGVNWLCLITAGLNGIAGLWCILHKRLV